MEFDVHSAGQVQQVLDEAQRQHPALAGWRFELQNAQPASVELVAAKEASSWKMTVPLDGTAKSADVERAVMALIETASVAINEEAPVSTPWLRA